MTPGEWQGARDHRCPVLCRGIPAVTAARPAGSALWSWAVKPWLGSRGRHVPHPRAAPRRAHTPEQRAQHSLEAHKVLFAPQNAWPGDGGDTTCSPPACSPSRLVWGGGVRWSRAGCNGGDRSCVPVGPPCAMSPPETRAAPALFGGLNAPRATEAGSRGQRRGDVPRKHPGPRGAFPHGTPRPPSRWGEGRGREAASKRL